MADDVLVICGVVMVIGLVGIVLPVLPGLLLIVGTVAAWALVEQTTLAWAVLAVTVVVTAGSQVAKYLIPGRRLSAAGVPRRTLVAGGVLALVGFFVVPVVGLFLGFVLGVYLAEHVRLKSSARAWPSTKQAVAAVGLSILIELAAGVTSFALWLGAVYLSR